VATMLLGGERGVGRGLDASVGEDARKLAEERARALARAHGVPAFALLSRLRLARAQAIVRRVQRRDARADARAHAGHVSWARAALLGGTAAVVASLTYDGAVARTHAPSLTDPLADYGFFDVAARALSPRAVASGWSLPGVALGVVAAVLG